MKSPSPGLLKQATLSRAGERDFGWRAVEHFGAAALLLGWRPNEFWSATPAELAAALRGVPGGGGAEPPGRGEIERLLAKFPDKHHG